MTHGIKEEETNIPHLYSNLHSCLAALVAPIVPLEKRSNQWTL